MVCRAAFLTHHGIPAICATFFHNCKRPLVCPAWFFLLQGLTQDAEEYETKARLLGGQLHAGRAVGAGNAPPGMRLVPGCHAVSRIHCSRPSPPYLHPTRRLPTWSWPRR